MQLFIEEYMYLCFFFLTVLLQQIFWHCPFLRSLHLAGHNRDGSIPILSVMLATDSIDLSIKNFSFLADRIDHRFEKKFFLLIESNHRLKIFCSSTDHRSNRCFFQLIDYRYRSIRCFFRHRCPTISVTYEFKHHRVSSGSWEHFVFQLETCIRQQPSPTCLLLIF